MRQGFTLIVALAAATTVSAQQGGSAGLTQQQRAEIELAQVNLATVRPRAAVEARITTGAPYSGEAVTEFSQVLSDGNRIARKTLTRVFRDSDGRTRREQTASTAGGGTVSVTIVDPVAGTSYVLDPGTRVALVAPTLMKVLVGAGGRGGAGAGAGAAAPASEPADLLARRREVELAAQPRSESVGSGQLRDKLERAASGNDTSTTESLGQQMMEGVMAEGTRTTTTIPAGTIGNAQPITIVSEQWFSTDLQVLVMTRHSDPRSGESTYRLTNIVRGEPDRSLFEVPADYTVKEPTALRRRQPEEPSIHER
jgi:hypothetical protein